MSFPVAFLLAFLGLVISVHERLNAVVLGRPVSIPWLDLIAAAVVLALAAVVLVLLRLLIRDGLGLRPRPVNL
jgi:hypothetical protein